MPSDAPTAFFSYSREDSEFALRLAGDLKAAGANVWLDQLDIQPGQRWARAVQDALNNAERVLVILSPPSVASTNVEDEVAFALEEHKTIIPVLYRDCKVPFQLRPFQYVDFRVDYARGLKVMLKTLGVGQQAAFSATASSTVLGEGGGTIANADDHSLAAEQARLLEEERARAEEARKALAEKEQREREQLVAAEQARLAEQERAREQRERQAATEKARREQDERERQAAAEQERLAKERADAARAAAARQTEPSMWHFEKARLVLEQAEAPGAGEKQPASTRYLPKAAWIALLCAVAVAGLVWLIANRKQSQPTNPAVTTTQPPTAPETNSAASNEKSGSSPEPLAATKKPAATGSSNAYSSNSLSDASNVSSRFVIGGPSDAQTVLDTKSGLMWTRKDYWDVEGKYAKSWYDAMDWAKKMNASAYAGFSDWTVPTVAQYRTINSSKADREVYARTFDKTDATDFWSSNTPNKNVASYVGFGLKDGGWAVSGSRIDEYGTPPSVRLVRSK